MATSGGVYDKINLAATVRTAAIPVMGAPIFAYAFRTTGTATGNWRVQGSNDFIPGTDDATQDTKWDTYTPAAGNPADAAGSAQTFSINLPNFPYLYARVKFTRTGGSGTGEAWSAFFNT